MRPAESFLAQPIRSLQSMLRVVGFRDNRNRIVIPDGIYGPQTMAAVAAFQKSHSLPVTGITDQQTWDALVRVYEPALADLAKAQTLEIILNPNQVIREGDASPYLYLAQALLLVLSQTYGSISAPSQSGILDIPTAEAIASFQALTRLPTTGELDKLTWKHLALHFPLAANIGNGTPWVIQDP